MTEFDFVRGDRYALTFPLTINNALIDLTAVGWSVSAVLSELDVIKAKTEAADPLKCTIICTGGNGFATVTLVNSALLSVGYYELEIRAVNGTTVYTWPTWTVHITEPRGI